MIRWVSSHVGYLVYCSKLQGRKYLLLSLFSEGASKGNNSYYDTAAFYIFCNASKFFQAVGINVDTIVGILPVENKTKSTSAV